MEEHPLTKSTIGAKKLTGIEINRLIDQNAQRLVDTRLHFANMAHSLKIPVASLMLALTDRTDPDGSMRKLIERIDRRIRYHLADAQRASEGDALRSVTVIKPRLDDLILALRLIYADRQISADCVVGPSLAIVCAAEDSDEIFGNILNNAFKWTAVKFCISAEIEGQMIRVTIADDGPECRRPDLTKRSGRGCALTKPYLAMDSD